MYRYVLEYMWLIDTCASLNIVLGNRTIWNYRSLLYYRPCEAFDMTDQFGAVDLSHTQPSALPIAIR